MCRHFLRELPGTRKQEDAMKIELTFKRVIRRSVRIVQSQLKLESNSVK